MQDGWVRNAEQCFISSQCHPEHCPPLKSCRFLGVIFGVSAMWHPTVLGESQQRQQGRGMGARVMTGGGKGLPTKPKRAEGTPGHPPTPFRTCGNRTLLDLQAGRAARLRSLPVSHRCPPVSWPFPCSRGEMWCIPPPPPPPQQPQPLPGAHLALTFPGVPSMPAGCHSKSKSYKQNEEKSLISIYSNEACNNANHKSCSHCYSISVSYPSPHIFLGCLSSSLHSQSPSQPGDMEGTVPIA